jgi:hypothetical protein
MVTDTIVQRGTPPIHLIVGAAQRRAFGNTKRDSLPSQMTIAWITPSGR